MALFTFMVVMVGPAKAMGAFPWWNVRFFDGIYYLIDHNSGWQEQLETWEVMSLEEAMHADPEMGIYIHGHSHQGSGSTEHPPIWNSQARQWLISLQPPGPNDYLALSLDLPLLYMRVEEKQREEERRNEERRWQACKGSRSQEWQEWQPHSWWDWEDASGCGGSTPSSSSTGYSGPATWEPEEGRSPWHPKWSNERYFTRGWGSACKRHQRRGCEQRGEPVPDHLMAKKTELAKGFKKEMMELVKKAKKAAEASSDSEMPEKGKKEEPAKAASTPGDESSSEWSYDPKTKRRSDSPMPGKHGPRWKGTPPNLAKVPVGDKKELEVEKMLKAKIKEEEEEDDDEEDSEEPEKANKKKKKRRRKSKKPEKGGVKPDEPGDGYGGDGGAGGGGGGGAGEGTAAVTAAA